jgi:hypothetical protein
VRVVLTLTAPRVLHRGRPVPRERVEPRQPAPGAPARGTRPTPPERPLPRRGLSPACARPTPSRTGPRTASRGAGPDRDFPADRPGPVESGASDCVWADAERQHPPRRGEASSNFPRSRTRDGARAGSCARPARRPRWLHGVMKPAPPIVDLGDS